MSAGQKIAVIGSGPAAFGALLKLVELKKQGRDLDITVYACGDEGQEERILANYKDRYSKEDINRILKSSKSEPGIMPARCFDESPVKSHVGQDGFKTEIKVSNSFGGIGNYWSSSVLPNHKVYDPVVEKLGDLSAQYDLINRYIPISGRKNDPLSRFFDDGGINQPAIHLDPALEGLLGESTCAGLELVMGVNRFAIQMDGQGVNSCIECGDCMYGCPRDVIFRAARPIWQMVKEGLCRLSYQKVLRFEELDKGVRLITDQGSDDFDQVFLAAGALGSMDVVHNSLGQPQKPLALFDTLLWYFPCFSLGLKDNGSVSRGIAFAELAGGLYQTDSRDYNHLLISRFPHAIIDKRFGRSKASLWLSNIINRFSLIGAVYGSHDEYVRYDLIGSQGRLLACAKEKSVKGLASHKFKTFKDYLGSKGWLCHEKLVMENATSSHYAGNVGLAYGIVDLPRHGRVSRNVTLCDSAAWDGPSMSQQHSLTIMAKAARSVIQSL